MKKKADLITKPEGGFRIVLSEDGTFVRNVFVDTKEDADAVATKWLNGDYQLNG
jgi:hypothetical protein